MLQEPGVLSVGHGTSEAAAFLELLADAGIEAVVDIRRFPGSRRHPHFGRDQMATWLPEHGVAYSWSEALGGRRKSSADSPHSGLRNAQFRAYADYMESEQFATGVAELLALADELIVTVMCSESVWWRCHRRLLADYLILVERRAVTHLFHDGRLAGHPVTPEARRLGTSVRYDQVTPTA